ncbi:hypothetical protein DL89DRAFT_258805 [Linderina pennispora]|uniref:Tyrosinase copper-binding domain-containing protein n=1 Tax=Linderina pennispora TaxID=61395 RepID=A0A1Y1W4C1_9FUNG|nr:uncharacterized protein DL89DRAFT_258805 [Linderina pennispora]ORX68232.1 hypothetical protein DL89DRAFT_258805 [Linderina pennispora]
MEGVEGRWGRNYPSRGCLVRKFRYGTTPGSFWPMRAVRDVMASSQSHAEFRSRIENGAHGIIHLGLGGDFETMWAPVDVLFFLHHAMVDKIWAEWQSKNPSRLRRVDGFDSSHQPLTVNSPLPFYGDTIGTTLVTTAPGYCYMYDDVAPPPDNARSRAVEFRASVRNSFEFSNDTDPDNELFAAHEDAEDLEAPEPAPENWLSKRGLDVQEAARMHVLVSRVVRQMNEERRAFIRALNSTKAATTDQNQPL